MKFTTFRIICIIAIIFEPAIIFALHEPHPQLIEEYWKTLLFLPSVIGIILLFVSFLNRTKAEKPRSQFMSILDLEDDTSYITRNVSPRIVTLSEVDEEDCRAWFQIEIEEFDRWRSKIRDNQTVIMRSDEDSVRHGDSKKGDLILVRTALEPNDHAATGALSEATS